MKNFNLNLKERLATLDNAFYLVLFLSFYLILALFRWEISPQHASYIYYPVADASLILLFCLPFRGKWKIITLIFPFLLAALLLANILFSRYFGDLIPPSFYFTSGVFNEDTFNGSFSALRWYDIFYLVFAFIPVVFAYAIKFKVFFKLNAGLPLYIIDLFLIFLSFGAVVGLQYRRLKKIYPDKTLRQFLGNGFTTELHDWKWIYDKYDLTGYFIKCGIKLNNSYITLTDKENHIIKEFIERQSALNNKGAKIDKSSVPENLIFIVVESWPSVTMEMDNSNIVTPYLNSLLQDSGVVVGNMKVGALYGNSSDAQFIYNTGLLPLKDEALVARYSYNDYPSLAKAFKGYSEEVISEDTSIWHHGSTNKSYGYDNLVDRIAFEIPIDKDSYIFNKALEEAVRLKNNFYLFVTTMSMHSPYRTSTVSSTLDVSNLGTDDARDKEYLRRLNHFDSELGKFIDGLKKSGIYDKTLIVIAGDHDVPDEEISDFLADDHVPFVILNSPVTGLKQQDFAQIDLFPTILYLMDLDYKYFGVNYTGLGVNMFVEAERQPSEQAYKISEWIIKQKP